MVTQWSTVWRNFSNVTQMKTCLRNFYFYIYISAVSGSLCVGCNTSCYFRLCLWDCRLADWRLLICSGLGTNAQKHSVDGTHSRPFPLAWCFLAVCTAQISLWTHRFHHNMTLQYVFFGIWTHVMYPVWTRTAVIVFVGNHLTLSELFRLKNWCCHQ